MVGRVVHFEVPYDDASRARSFYRDVFGWKIDEIPEMDYTLVATGPSGEQGPTEPGYIGGGMFQRGGEIDRPVITLEVEDIEVTLEAVEERGGSQVGETLAVGELGRAAYFKDPEGNLMGLWQSASAAG